MTTWLVAKTGSNTNGGTSQAVLATAADGVTNSSTNTLVSASALFTAGMVGQGVCINGSLRLITAYTSATTITYSGANLGVHTGYTWTIGGPWLTVNTALVTANAVAAGDQIYIGGGVYRETVANARSGSQLSTTYNGTNGASLSSIGSVLTLTSVTGLVAPPAGYYNQGSVVTSAGVVGFTWTGISGSTLTGVTFLTNNTVTSAATVATSATLIVSIPVWVIGDVDGAQTGAAGQVVSTAFTTNDTTAPSATGLLSLAATINLSFALITYVGGTGNPSIIGATGATTTAFYTFIDCTLNKLANGTQSCASFVSSTTGLALGIIFDRCTIMNSSGSIGVNVTVATTASGSTDWDALVLIRNCLILGCSTAINVTGSGTAANNGGGVRALNNTTFLAASASFMCATASHISTLIPCEVHNSIMGSFGTGVSAATSGQLVEDHNIIDAGTPRTNVTAGTGSQTTAYALTLELGQSFKWAMGTIRQFLAPDGPTSVLLGFGSAPGAPATDWANRPRPSGGASALNAVGYAEFHDFAEQNTSTVPSGQTSAAELVGPGDQDLWVPVDATATTISIQLYQGSGYGGTNYASATLLANGELGVTTQVETCTSTTGSWQTLTFTSFTPSKQGWVKVRITSFDSSGTGTLLFGALT